MGHGKSGMLVAMELKIDKFGRVVLPKKLRSMKMIDVATQSYIVAIVGCANGGWRGGRVHDAVHIQAAAQAGCDLIYTYDVAHFESLAPGWIGRIQNPPRA